MNPNFIVFQNYAYTALTEVIDQQIQLFNEATQGGIMLTSESMGGDFSEETFYKKIPNLVRRRNAYTDGGTAPTARLEMGSLVSVKVAGGTPLTTLDPSYYDWIMRDAAEAGTAWGQQLAGDMLGDMLNTAIGCFVAATTNFGSALVNDVSGTANPTLKGLMQTSGLFGDRRNAINTWVMHSNSLTDIYGEAFDNSDRLFEFGNVRVATDGHGRTLIETDSDNLVEAGTPDKYKVMGLVAGAIEIKRNDDYRQEFENVLGEENLNARTQAQWSYNMGMKGYKWDEANGGKSPSDAALFTGTKWDAQYTSRKDMAGVLMIAN